MSFGTGSYGSDTDRNEGKIVYRNSQGFTSIDDAVAKPISPDTTFWIASCTKLMTSVAAMQCVERGLLSLDDANQVSLILPEYASADILSGFDESTGAPQLKKASKKITLRHLLSHSSGLGYDFISPVLLKWKEWSKTNSKPNSNSAKEVSTIQASLES